MHRNLGRLLETNKQKRREIQGTLHRLLGKQHADFVQQHDVSQATLLDTDRHDAKQDSTLMRELYVLQYITAQMCMWTRAAHAWTARPPCS